MLHVLLGAIASLMVAVWAALADSVPLSTAARRRAACLRLLPWLLYVSRRVRDEVRHFPQPSGAESCGARLPGRPQLRRLARGGRSPATVTCCSWACLLAPLGQVVVVELLGSGDRRAVPLVPAPGLVAGHEQDHRPPRVEDHRIRISLRPAEGGRSSFMLAIRDAVIVPTSGRPSAGPLRSRTKMAWFTS